ncbi:hypothetical protein Dret_1513 [Desulfohalobium retbaense DSM 5692]|uniref:Uncharacterized protein n=1 Tax=Desulfohalobium retbaense (strain ATCC 49708 / DSM 5692 / JCM 16813 / HR100) TaxID=485915 RepID=C8X302_DESRD|nr:hypothetical protein Dret_1513 [Desulfohalobium retbaense DSM 5692]
MEKTEGICSMNSTPILCANDRNRIFSVKSDGYEPTSLARRGRKGWLNNDNYLSPLC